MISNQEIKIELLNFLKEEYKKPNVVVMPDFFFDRIVTFDYDITKFLEKIKKIIARKGGNLDGISQINMKGGNAINTAYALAALGAIVTPIVVTNNKGMGEIRSNLKIRNIDLSHIKIKNDASITTALELKTGDKKVNIMIRNLGDLKNFQASDLTIEDKKIIDDSDYVCLFNWAGTKNFGTILAQQVFSRVKKRGIGITYYDTADPNSNPLKIPELVKTMQKADYIDILSLNENEAISYASIIEKQFFKKNKKIKELALEAAKILANNLNSRIDLHTSSFAATITKKKEVKIRTFKIKPLRITGAGDAWNAGNIIGDMNKLSDECRLMLANAVSAYYISSPDGSYPNRKKISNFIKKKIIAI